MSSNTNTFPTFELERGLYDDGATLVCGVDEAGRGPLAGPVYAAAVVLPRDCVIAGLNDSKKLTPQARERLYDEIIALAVTYAVASADVAEIDALGILAATHLAMNRAVAALSPAPSIALVDGNQGKNLDFPHRLIVHGDALSLSIAAASVLAKVERDRYMVELAARYPAYGFEQHKGYGTKAHYAALRELGATPEHRPLFLRKMH
ncbi:MAG: ribonuclease HII [Oscillospiraceae bacterium]|jgi:ribonuclease HII|nr:ribonuclease HII [Oscillospiraceae bacterium]